MRIAYFTDTFLPQINGVTNTLERLGAYLASKDIRHQFFAPQYYGTSKAPVKSPVHRFNSVSLPLYPECRLSVPFYPGLCKAADRFRPDIVHIVTPLGIGLSGLKYARERNIPVVSSFHTNFDAYLKYYKLDYMEEAVWRFFRWFHSFCSINFCPSPDTMERLVGKGIENARLWTRGIDIEEYTPKARDAGLRSLFSPDGRMVFLYVGRLAAEKDLDILSDSINKIGRAYPGQAQFVWVGDGPMAKQLKENAPENTVFTGYLKGRELAAAYASADAFVFPSSTETFGNVILEAMASGLPVVAVNSGGVRDNVRHGYNGLLCAPRDSESFAEGIARFLENKEQTASMGKNARAYTLRKTWSSVFDRLIYDYGTAVESAPQKLYETA